MIGIRNAGEDERKAFLSSKGGKADDLKGFLIVESGGVRIGHAGYKVENGVFLVHDVELKDPSGMALATLTKRLSRLSTMAGFGGVLDWFVDPPLTDMMRLVESGRATLVRAWIRMETVK